MSPADQHADLRAELVAVVISVDERPQVLASDDPLHLPAGPLRTDHNSLQNGVRAFAKEQTGHELGYVEQLYTFADLDRADGDARTVSISYLGLTRPSDSTWVDLYSLLPWEDRRDDDAVAKAADLRRRLFTWAGGKAAETTRVETLFGDVWRTDLALQRYELLWEAGLVAESPDAADDVVELTGPRMHVDHRRILATGLSRLRSTLQYRPVVFELVPDEFTLGRLQAVVEAIAGQTTHKQNFRRVVEQQHALVEPTGETDHSTGGRPARLYRFRREVLEERRQVGTKLPLPRSR